MAPKLVSVEQTGKRSLTAPNPEYSSWLGQDQQVLSYLANSLSPEILTHVRHYEHAVQVWKALEDMFPSQSRSKVMNLRIAIANTKKINMTTPTFFSKMQSIANELAVAGKTLDDEEIVSFILVGLGSVYDGLVGAIGLLTTPLSVNEFMTRCLIKISDKIFNAHHCMVASNSLVMLP